MRRRFVVLFSLVALVWALFGATFAAAYDEEREGGTTGSTFVTNKYVWVGDTSRYGQVEARYHIDVIGGSQVFARWECRSRNGPTDTFTTAVDGSWDVTGATHNGAAFVLADQDTYCAYHVWSTTGGFRITTAKIRFWNQEFIGGGGTNPTPAPGETAGPGTTSGTTPAPTATPSPSPSPGSAAGCADESVYQTFAAGSRQCLADADFGGVLPTGTTFRIDHAAIASQNQPGTSKTATVWLIASETVAAGQAVMDGLTEDVCSGGHPEVFCVPNAFFSSDSTAGANTLNSGTNSELRTLAGPARYLFLVVDSKTPGTQWYTNGTSYVTVFGSPSNTPMPTASATPSPTPGASATPTPTPSPPGGGFLPPPVAPPLPTPTTGPNRGGSDGLEEPSPPDPNGNGLALCDAQRGGYSKPGQAPLQPLNDTSFPGSVNPLDYIPWVGNMVANIPIVVSNTAQTTINTGVDFVIPGECISTIIDERLAAIQEHPPISWWTTVHGSVTTAAGAGGGYALPAIPLPGGGSVALPLADVEAAVAPLQGILTALVWLTVGLTCLRMIGRTFGADTGSSGP